MVNITLIVVYNGCGDSLYEGYIYVCVVAVHHSIRTIVQELLHQYPLIHISFTVILWSMLVRKTLLTLIIVVERTPINVIICYGRGNCLCFFSPLPSVCLFVCGPSVCLENNLDPTITITVLEVTSRNLTGR